MYCFSVRDNKGRWSEEACLELNIDPALPPVIPWFWISIAVLAAAIPTLTYSIKRIRFGSMRISSNPDGAMVFLDKIQMGRSPIKINKVPIGPHIVEFVKFGYFVGKKEGVVILNKTSIVHIELSAIPDMKLKLSADSTEIPADGRSISTITICLQGKKEDKGSIPIIVPIDTEVTITTDLGSIVSPVKINAGSSLTTATLTSSTSIGITTVTARVKNVDRIDLEDSITINFLDPTIVA